MTGGEMAAVSGITMTAGAVVIGAMKLIAVLTNGRKKSIPPPDHGPCNEAVDELAEVIRGDMQLRREHHREDREQRKDELVEQRKLREALLRWMAVEEDRRNRRTGEFPVAG